MKGPEGLMLSATKQAAYDGAVMVDTAWESHQFMSKPANDFLGRTQALTGTVNGSNVHIYANHAISSEARATDHVVDGGISVYPDKLQYHQYPAKGVLACESLEDFKKA
jgi:ABC-type proline/glycine betaine transport system substrate-binding protein